MEEDLIVDFQPAAEALGPQPDQAIDPPRHQIGLPVRSRQAATLITRPARLYFSQAR